MKLFLSDCLGELIESMQAAGLERTNMGVRESLESPQTCHTPRIIAADDKVALVGPVLQNELNTRRQRYARQLAFRVV